MQELEAEFLSQRDNIESTKEHLASLCRRYQSGELKDVQGNVAKLIAKHADLLLAIQKSIVPSVTIVSLFADPECLVAVIRYIIIQSPSVKLSVMKNKLTN